jgi:hypothetical protein
MRDKPQEVSKFLTSVIYAEWKEADLLYIYVNNRDSLVIFRQYIFPYIILAFIGGALQGLMVKCSVVFGAWYLV